MDLSHTRAVIPARIPTMNYAATIPAPLAPLNQVQQPVVLDPAAFRANPETVKQQHHSRTFWDGTLFAIAGAALGLVASSRMPNRTAAILGGTALGGALGLTIAQFGKTKEEAYSQIFTDAAHSSDFVGHVKREMDRRESGEFVTGLLTGMCITF